jgi:uncharacterized protein YbcI
MHADMSDTETQERLAGGRLQSAISRAVVRVVAEFTGRGPTGARTTIAGDWIFVVLEDNLTRGERKLAETGHSDFVISTRRKYQEAMREEIRREIEALTGRTVEAFLSASHIDPDVAVEAIKLAEAVPADT